MNECLLTLVSIYFLRLLKSNNHMIGPKMYNSNGSDVDDPYGSLNSIKT